jgi:hypothetical protein
MLSENGFALEWTIAWKQLLNSEKTIRGGIINSETTTHTPGRLFHS